MTYEITTYGKKHGDGPGGFDCTILPNPHNVDNLKRLDGRHPRIKAFVLGSAPMYEPRAKALLDRAFEQLKETGKTAFFCYGGQHRSVAMAETLKEEFERAGFTVNCVHRDLR